MALNLQKKIENGSKLNLTKQAPSLKRVLVELGWEKRVAAPPLDLDISVFGLNAQGRAIEECVCFFNQPDAAGGRIKSSGDNRVGGAVGTAAESITIDLASLIATPQPGLVKQAIFATINDAKLHGHHFGLLREAYLKLIDADTGAVIVQYDLDAQFNELISVEVGNLSLENGSWVFTEVGVGYKDQGFMEVAQAYGL